MLKSSAFLLLSAALLANCQQNPVATNAPMTNIPPQASAPAQPTSLTEAEAQAAVGRYLQAQPNAALYVLDSARVHDNQTSWQVLVPRTDWAKRMPNRARFEVDKATGNVSSAPVK